MNYQHLHISRKFSFALSCLLIVGCSFLRANVLYAAKRLSSVDQKAVNKLIYDFGQPGKNRAEIVKTVLGYGPTAATVLLKRLDYSLRLHMPRYESSFKSVAERKLRSDLKSKKKTIDEHRKALRQLRQKGNNLRKSEIVARGDPALAALREIFFPSRESILGGDERLQKQRKGVIFLLECKNDCLKVMGKDQVKFMEELATNERGQLMELIYKQVKGTSVMKTNAKLKDKIEPLEAEGIDDLNMMRMLMGLGALKIDVKLCDACRDHSKDMKTKKFFAHNSPVPGKKTPWDRAKNFKTTARAENIAYGRRKPQQTNMGWFHSPGHHVNMLDPNHAYMGLGHYRTYWTQLFR